MKKILPVILVLLAPTFYANAQSLEQKAEALCSSEGGIKEKIGPVERDGQFCITVTCKKTTDPSGDLNVDASSGPDSKGSVGSKRTTCVPKAVIQTAIENASNGSGNGNGNGSGSGSANGNGSGSGSGNSSGGGSGVIACNEILSSGRIVEGGLCYNECKESGWWLWKEVGLEREECVDCLLANQDVYTVDKRRIPAEFLEKYQEKFLNISGVQVRTGAFICKDSNGNIVQGVGSVCPAGATMYGGGPGVGSGGATIILSGAGGGSSSGGSRSSRRFDCSSGSDEEDCLGDEAHRLRSRYERECVNCGAGSRQQSTLSGWAELVGAIAPPLAMVGSAYIGARAYENANTAWANQWGASTTAGFEQCRLAQNYYMDQLAKSEQPALTPEQRNQMNCNGYQLGGFAGLGGGMNPFMSGGYSQGFMGGMMGPYGMHNPYGMGGGGMVGGFGGGYGMPGGMVGGIVGGFGAGMAGGGYPAGFVGGYGMPGGMVGGFGAGMAGGGYPAGFGGGYGMPGGMVGGIVGGIGAGMAGGGYPAGFGGGYGMPGGMVGGIGGNIGLGIGGGGYPGGFGGGFNGGFGGGFNGGFGGGFNGGFGGGFNGGWGSGVGNSGYSPGGFPGGGGNYWGASGGWGGNPQADFYASQQASNYDQMMQMQGSAYQMGGGGYGGYGSAGYGPMNAGYSMGGYAYGSFGM